MSHVISILGDTPSAGVALLLLASTYAFLLLVVALVAAFHRASARREAALRVLGLLLQALPLGADEPSRLRTRRSERGADDVTPVRAEDDGLAGSRSSDDTC